MKPHVIFMEQYLSKSALVAAIERRMKKLTHTMSKFYYASNYKEWESVAKEYKSLTSFINTLEVKEVDLEKEFKEFLDNVEGVPSVWHSDEQIEWAKDIAKHFYELGLKTQKGA